MTAAQTLNTVTAVHTFRLPPRPSVVRSLSRESFYDFLEIFWDTIVPEAPVFNWHIRELCDLYQYAAERVFRGLPKEADTIINIPPGTTKSTIGSIMFLPWCWTRLPSFRMLNGSHTSMLTYELSRKARQVVNHPEYGAAFPEIQLSADQNTKGLWANTAGGSRLACTVGGVNPVGFHAHFQNIDDPIDPQKADSEEKRVAANKWMDETLPSRKVDKLVTPMFLIMQRLHQDDPTGHVLEKKKEKAKKAKKKGVKADADAVGVNHINLPARLTTKVKPARYRRKYKKGLLDPVRLNARVLAEAEEDLGPYGYAGQYMEDPVPRGGGTLPIDRVTPGTPPDVSDNARWSGIVRYWDKAGTAGGGAWTVGLLMGLTAPVMRDTRIITPGRYWLLDVVRFQKTAWQREDIIEDTTAADRLRYARYRVGLEQEGGSGGKESAENTAARLAGSVVSLDSPRGDKASRAEPMASQMAANNFSYLVGADWWATFYAEARYFPFSRYKDQVDAASGAFADLRAQSVRKRVGAM